MRPPSRRCSRAGSGRSALPEEIEDLLEANAADMSAPGYDFDTGHGLVDARAAFETLFRFLHDPLKDPPRR